MQEAELLEPVHHRIRCQCNMPYFTTLAYQEPIALKLSTVDISSESKSTATKICSSYFVQVLLLMKMLLLLM